MENFHLIDHTSDIGLVANGHTLEETFVNAARGLFSIMIDEDKSSETECRKIYVSETDAESLLVKWLNELIYFFDAENLFFTKFDVTHLTDQTIKANCYGDKLDPSIHSINIGVKAATYHMLEIKKIGDIFNAQILFDV